MVGDILRNARASIRNRGWHQTLITYGHILRWQFAKRITRSEVLIRKIHDYRMYLSLREPGISESLNMFGSREPEHFYVIDRVLRPGMCVLDIGGNIGYYALMEAKRVGPLGKVYAVEPVPSNCRLLRQSVALNHFEQIIEVDQLAISDHVGTRTLQLSRQSNLHSIHVDVDPSLKNLLELSGDTLAVSTVDLGTFIKGRRRPSLLRMDIEGHEVEILSDLASLAQREAWYPAVLFEVHAKQYDFQSHDIRKPLRSLLDLGYRFRYIASQHEPSSALAELGYRPTTTVSDSRTNRGIYEGVLPEHALAIVPQFDQVRCVYLYRPASQEDERESAQGDCERVA